MPGENHLGHTELSKGRIAEVFRHINPSIVNGFATVAEWRVLCCPPLTRGFGERRELQHATFSVHSALLCDHF